MADKLVEMLWNTCPKYYSLSIKLFKQNMPNNVLNGKNDHNWSKILIELQLKQIKRYRRQIKRYMMKCSILILLLHSEIRLENSFYTKITMVWHLKNKLCKWILMLVSNYLILWNTTADLKLTINTLLTESLFYFFSPKNVIRKMRQIHYCNTTYSLQKIWISAMPHEYKTS